MSGSHYLSGLFNPLSLTVVGASKRNGSLGLMVFDKIQESHFDGACFPVNPKYSSLNEKKCYRSLNHLPQSVDLAIVVTPEATWPKILQQCNECKIGFVVILSESLALGQVQNDVDRDRLRSLARRFNIRLLGPNSLGFIRPHLRLNASLMESTLVEGKLALVSQSGALCTAMLDWAKGRGIGFSAVLSTGGSIDVDFAEALDFLVADPKTQSILVYIEGVENARGFMSSLRAAARIKPVTVVKSGRHKADKPANFVSHTGSLVGSDQVFDAALQRAGVIRGKNLGDLFYVASVLARGQFLRNGDLAIVSNGSGPGIMASDRAWDLKLPLAKFSQDTAAALSKHHLHIDNPLDLGAQASAESYSEALRWILKDPGVAAVLVLLAPQSHTQPTAVAEVVVALAKTSRKPLIACWMGDNSVREGRSILYQAGVPSFRLPEIAVQAISYLADFRHNQRLLRQTPGPLSDTSAPNLSTAKDVIAGALDESRSLLTEVESKQLLAAFHIPVVNTRVARNVDEALRIADDIGFPLVLKVYSKKITHKSDVDGVRLGIANTQEVVSAFNGIYTAAEKFAPGKIEGVVLEPMVSFPNGRELLIGIVRDPVFGPVVSFGFGGIAAELLAETSVGLPPLNELLAEELISRTRAEKLLGAVRRVPAANRNAVINVLLRVSEMACEIPNIKEMDINPLLVDDSQAIVLDARIVVDHQKQEEGLRYAHTAIHPYPAHLQYKESLANGDTYLIRPIRPEDANIERYFIDNLSEQAKFFRFMHVFKKMTPEMLARFTLIDYEKEIAFVAVVGQGADQEIIGVSRFAINYDLSSCDFGIVVGDKWQKQGVAKKIMQVLMNYARNRGLTQMEGDVLADNHSMLSFCKKLGFVTEKCVDDSTVVKVIKTLA